MCRSSSEPIGIEKPTVLREVRKKLLAHGEDVNS
jgi:hypothetical protein